MTRRPLTQYLNHPELLLDISLDDMKKWAEEVPYSGLIQRLLTQKILLEESVDQDDIDRAKAMTILSNSNPNVTFHKIEEFKAYILSGEYEQKDENNKPDASTSSIPDHEGDTKKEEESTPTVMMASPDSAFSSPKGVPSTEDLDALRAMAFAQTDELDASPSPSEATKAELEAYLSTLGLEESDANDRINIPDEKLITSTDETSSDNDVAEAVNEDSEIEVDESKTIQQVEDSSFEDHKSFYLWLEDLSTLDIAVDLDDEPTSTMGLDTSVASESLAQLLVHQGHVQQAIDMYQSLILKYPEKSSFFASQIKELKAL